MASIAYVGSTNTIELTGLNNRKVFVTGDAAQVTLTIKNTAGATIDGPKPMHYISGTDGDFVGGITRRAPLVAGTKYTAIVDVDASNTNAELYGHWEMPFTAQTRKK